MMMLVSGMMGALGLVCIISRRTLLGIMIGIQLLVLGSAMMFVLAGVMSGARVEGHLFGLFIVLSGVAQLAGGYALAIRVFYLKTRTNIDELRSLKQ
ncbi:NADH-quinone oxidoreductase subunit K [Bdellovibrionota bacterium FG-1]